MKDLNKRELALLVPLAVLMVVLGMMPAPFLAKSEPAVQHLLEVIETKKAIGEAGMTPAAELVLPAPISE